LVTDVSINMAIIHQMILRYISVYFSTLPIDQSVGLLKYDQLVVLLKNKFLNAPNEDILLEFLECWLEGNDNFRVYALEFDQNQFSSRDNGLCFKQLQELIENINWPILSLNVIMKIISKPGGQLKRFKLIQKTLFDEVLRRESGYLLPKSKEMPLRYCQINGYKSFFVNRGFKQNEYQGF
jgi:hypothetical protein